MNTIVRLLVPVSCVLICVSCATTSREESATAARESLPELPDAWATAQETVGDVEVGWLLAIGDETLTELVREAQENNRDLQAAAANVERSWALAGQAGAALLPAVDLIGGASEGGGFDNSTSSSSARNIGVQVNWELDIWGRIRAGEQAAVAQAESVEADFRYAQHSLAAAVARAYYLAIEAGLQADVVRNTLDALTETNRIVKVRLENGVGSSQDLALSNSDLATARAALAEAEGAQRSALRALEVLLGRYPAADLAVRASLPDAPPQPPAGVPSEILERRPDIVAAERRVAAAFNSLDQAKAARLPAISLTSTTGASSSELSNLLSPSNLAWTVGANLLVPIFDGGARQAEVEAATAEQKQAIAVYGQVALETFQEVESNLDQGAVLRNRNGALNEAANEANNAYRIAELRYSEGETDLLDLLTIQQRVFNAESSLTAVRRAGLEQWINLNLALGGSWE